jgi:cyanophycinase
MIQVPKSLWFIGVIDMYRQGRMTDTTVQPIPQTKDNGDLQPIQQGGAAAQNSASTEQTHGQLVIIGGAEDREGECTILREFVRRAGGTNARLIVMTVATSLPEEVGNTYIGVFERLGVESVEVVDSKDREEGNDPNVLAKFKEVTGVFFTGGDQRRITELLKNTELHKLLLHRLQNEGLVIGGTSAGAAMMPDNMIAEGDSETHARMEAVEIEEGMGFFPDVAIAQHFAQRGRLGRLVAAISLQPVVLGFGIDENTAIIVNGDEIEVVGESAITVIDAEDMTHSNIHGVLKDEPLALCDAKLHILPHGYRYNLKTKSAICN